MKRLCLIFALVLLLSGCDKSDKDISVDEYKFYIGSTEHYDITTYNGYKCTEYSELKNADGTYTVTFKFSKLGVD